MKKTIVLLPAVGVVISLFIVILILCMAIPVSAMESAVWDGTIDTEWEGSGTEESPYLITSAKELAGLSYMVAQDPTNTYEGKYFKQTTDIKLNDTSDWKAWSNDVTPSNIWIPIGGRDISGSTTQSHYFKGTYDGDGHIVSGIYTTNRSYTGLFGYIQYGASIKNIGVVESYISGEYYVGGVIGLAEGPGMTLATATTISITNCFNKGTIVGTDSSIGGIVGKIRASFSTTTNITDCYNQGCVTGSGDGVGGIVGSSGANGDGFSALVLKNCYNLGEIIGKEDRVGGLVGYFNSGSVNNCYNTGIITGHEQVAGLLGYVNSNVRLSNCYNEGQITGTGRIGGLFGAVNDFSKIEESYNLGIIKGINYVGGIAGQINIQKAEAYVRSCCNFANVCGTNYVGGMFGECISTSGRTLNITYCYNESNVKGDKYVGGLIGKNWTAIPSYADTVINHIFETSGIILSNSYNTGTVIGDEYVGGIVGMNNAASYNSKYLAKCIITNCYNKGEINGNTSYIGGIVGYNCVEDDAYTIASQIINTNCYNSGQIIISQNSTNVGGIVGGKNKHTVSKCYYLVGTAVGGINSIDSTGCTEALTDVLMRLPSSFVGWDFDSVWIIGQFGDYPYPTLRWQSATPPWVCNHTWENWTKVDDNNHKHTCSVCGKVETAEHTWNAGVVTTQPTHTTFGVKTYTCSGCGVTKTEQVAKLTEHTYGEWQNHNAEQHKHTCACGNIEYENHSWNNGTVTTQPTHTTFGIKTYTCSGCGVTKTEQVAKLTEHTYGEWQNHNAEQHKHTCACGNAEYENHSWNNGTVTTQPTHTTFGVKTYTCSGCGVTKTEQVAKLTEHTYGEWQNHNAEQHKHTCACGSVEYENHDWDNGQITTQATCKNTGVKTYTCMVCGETKTETVAKLTTHSYGDWQEDDVSNHKHTCLVCGKVETASHSWNSGVVTTKPTCKNTGINTYTCMACGQTKTESIAISMEHTWESWTKLDDINHKHTCSVCGKVETADHAWNAGVVTTQPTHTTFGVKIYTCSGCGTTKTEQVAKLTEHTYGEWQKYNAEQHKKTCACGDVIYENHIAGEWEQDGDNKILKCMECGEVLDVKENDRGETTLPDNPGLPTESNKKVVIWIVSIFASTVLLVAVFVLITRKKKSKL